MIIVCADDGIHRAGKKSRKPAKCREKISVHFIISMGNSRYTPINEPKTE
jgi:hypothetical protein